MIEQTPATAPTATEVDKLIAEYAAAAGIATDMGAMAKEASDKAGDIKVRLTAMVETWGGRHTAKSKRLAGLHNMATTTTATRVSIDDTGVEKLRTFLSTTEQPELGEQFFVAHTSYSLIAGPDEKLKTLTMGGRLRLKIRGLLKNCFEIRTSAPSLKIEMGQLKPARSV